VSARPPSGQKCGRCGENDATVHWGDVLALTHGAGEWWCERCAVEEQVKHARERAAQLPKLEARLAQLGGPAAKVCRCKPYLLSKQRCPVHGAVDFTPAVTW
jgi:RNA polymerase subunit RPABC4/transcription elongation factor Spt4